jgi:GntR family transcriptional repressor for pyruvate dehydrogenase complex
VNVWPVDDLSGHMGPVARRTLVEQVQDRLVQAIRAGVLTPGSAIPAERSLSDDFRVARASVREALQGLVSIGLLERRGNRTVVAERMEEFSAHHDQARRMELHELFEVRDGIEVTIARLATHRATDEERAAITKIAARFSPRMRVPEFRALDRTFHWTLARAAGNELLLELYGKVLDRIFRSPDFESMFAAAQNSKAVRELLTFASRQHRAIAEALSARDLRGVISAVRRHVIDTEGHVLERFVPPVGMLPASADDVLDFAALFERADPARRQG